AACRPSASAAVCRSSWEGVVTPAKSTPLPPGATEIICHAESVRRPKSNLIGTATGGPARCRYALPRRTGDGSATKGVCRGRHRTPTRGAQVDRLLRQPCTVVVPAGAGLLPAAPPGPALLVLDGVPVGDRVGCGRALRARDTPAQPPPTNSSRTSHQRRLRT